MFDRAPTFHVGAYICGLRIFLQVQLFLGLRIICVRRSCFLDLEYFMSADIFPVRELKIARLAEKYILI